MLLDQARKNLPEYRAWKRMRIRCNNKNTKDYKDYGGRGIKICSRWDNFMLFLLDMGQKPDETTLDRKDVNKDYSPRNCRWATIHEQANNKTSTVWVTIQGKRMSMRNACNLLNISYSMVKQRVKKLGWPIEMAIEIPSQRRK